MASLTPGLSHLVVIDTVWGHTGVLFFKRNRRETPPLISSFQKAGGGSNPTDDAFVQAEIKKFLEE
jgi:hypothetical protein